MLASSVALFCVWIGNGLWHGAGSQYLFFGLYYFVLIMAGGLIELHARVRRSTSASTAIAGLIEPFQTVRTLAIIFVGELFFRSNSLEAGLA